MLSGGPSTWSTTLPLPLAPRSQRRHAPSSPTAAEPIGCPSRGGAGSRAAAPRSASSARHSHGRPLGSRSPRRHCIARTPGGGRAETRSGRQMKTNSATGEPLVDLLARVEVAGRVVRRTFRGPPIPTRDGTEEALRHMPEGFLPMALGGVELRTQISKSRPGLSVHHGRSGSLRRDRDYLYFEKSAGIVTAGGTWSASGGGSRDASLLT